MNVLVRIKGIDVQGTSHYNGLTHFIKHPQSIFSLGKNCTFNSATTSNHLGINHPCMLTTEINAELSIGSNCGFSGVSIWCFKKIVIGNNVRIGANVTIMDGDAHLNDSRSGTPKPVIIKDNVWIGSNVTILKGVTIGKNSVIGSCSVVTKDIIDNCVAAGNPCVIKKKLDFTFLDNQ